MSNQKYWYISLTAGLMLGFPLIASQSDNFKDSVETKTNGTSLNGTSLNGTSLNGTSLNSNVLNTDQTNSFASQGVVHLEGGQLIIERKP